MIIGIDASRAFSGERTGIEEYSFQVIKNLLDKLKGDQVFLYIRQGQEIGFNIPKNWSVKKIKWPWLWTQLGLSLEMLLHPVDVLFVPAHVVPIIHPKKTIVTVHGLEYEFFPEGYSFWERMYMRWSIKLSCRWAEKIIAVSENTKKDLINLYKVPEGKIEVIYEGTSVSVIASEAKQSRDYADRIATVATLPRNDKSEPYILFIGRLEARKNIIGTIKAFEILNEKYKIPHQLILAGKFGHESKGIKEYLASSPHQSEIILPGFVSEAEKQELLKYADAFLFPSFYEGFGLPILEAQSAGVPVITSDISSLPEVAGEGALFVDPNSPKQIAEAAYSLISDKSLRDAIIEKGHKNAQKFNWEKCAVKIAEILAK